MSDFPICPKCDGYIPNNENPGAYPGAISRADNKTEICSDCGTQEALKDFYAKEVRGLEKELKGWLAK
jgi:hypothetical protein